MNRYTRRAARRAQASANEKKRRQAERGGTPLPAAVPNAERIEALEAEVDRLAGALAVAQEEARVLRAELTVATSNKADLKALIEAHGGEAGDGTRAELVETALGLMLQ